MSRNGHWLNTFGNCVRLFGQVANIHIPEFFNVNPNQQAIVYHQNVGNKEVRKIKKDFNALILEMELYQ